MNKKSTGKPVSDDRSDWERVKAMTDADISHNADSPRTVESDWDGAIIKHGGVVVGRTKKPVTTKAMSG
jgi:hypothetical protein